jgi:hypothetical protein
MVLRVGRHSVAKDRRRVSVLLGAFAAPAAVFLATGADLAHTATPEPDVKQVPEEETPAPCCMELVTTASAAQSWTPSVSVAAGGNGPAQVVSASRWRVVDVAKPERVLPVGKAPESGLQVKTILTARSISAAFPEISTIGGVRADALRWHPDGLALDVMIPNPGSDAGISLGNQIVAYVLKNARKFGIQDAIWRGVYYTPSGAQGGGYGHYDHVHITTFGGGYPSGNEVYR